MDLASAMRGADNDSPFDGFLDNIRIFGSQSDNSGALTLTQLDSIRAGDVPPTVSSTSPLNGATGVAINSTITAIFSEAMQSSTINTNTFTVSDGAGNISGTVSYSGTTATFTPSGNLSVSTTYTATITTGAQDAAGTAMASNYTWSFTTTLSTIPPQAQTAILKYKFDETGTTALSTGSDGTAVTLRNSSGAATDLHSSDGLGVSGG